MTGLHPLVGAGDPLVRPWCGSAAALRAVAAGLAPVWWLRGERLRTRAALLEEWAAAVPFPPHFGGNWDALRDCLADLPAGGTFLVQDAEQLLLEAEPADGALLLAVLKQARGDLAPRPLRVVLQAEPERFESLAQRLRALRAD